MQQDKVLKFVLDTLDDYKAVDVVNIDVRELTQICDNMVICSGTSTRHVKTIAEQLVKHSKEADIDPLGVEGLEDGEWVLVDLADVIVHVMLPATREFYSLEKLWMTAEEAREGYER
ncbi:MAG: ribosome silencing factor [Pseudomonadota bacterium]|nr:ribosome silencing factor [Pseudomonadota bacterium]